MGYNDYSYSKGNFNGNRNMEAATAPDPVKVASFYTSDNKSTINPDLFDGFAKKIAQSFVGTGRKGNSVGVSSTQLRKLFDEVKRFEQILVTSEGQWEKQLPYIKMIKSKVSYSVARAIKTSGDSEKVYKNLEVFISSSIDLIKTEQDYHIFVSLFESVYGFYYELAPKNCQ